LTSTPHAARYVLGTLDEGSGQKVPLSSWRSHGSGWNPVGEIGGLAIAKGRPAAPIG